MTTIKKVRREASILLYTRLLYSVLLHVATIGSMLAHTVGRLA